jgi:beta-lactamase class A
MNLGRIDTLQLSNTDAIKSIVSAGFPGATPTPTPAHPSFQPLADALNGTVSSSGAQVGISMTELGGPSPQSWTLNPDQQFTAASTYKLPLLMLDTQMVTSGRASLQDSICFQDDDWEDGYYEDYTDGACFTRQELEQRIGTYSDNTAAHMLVRVDGGSAAFNSFASSAGARESAFYDPNQTTAADLDRLWQSEATGRAGGAAAQNLLYPLLTNTSIEDGVPAGTPGGTEVVHKTGEVGNVESDAALVPKGPSGAYVLAVCTDGLGGDAGWQLIAKISQEVWNYESTR